MKKIEEYHVAYNGSPESLMKEVNDYINQGWQPYGEMKIAEPNTFKKDDLNLQYVQPMVRYSID